jgi:hypothetical protein
MKFTLLVKVDSPATAAAVRRRYGSVREFCRQVSVHPDTFYLALRGKRGGIRKSSNAAQILKRLEVEGLLIRGLAATPPLAKGL